MIATIVTYEPANGKSAAEIVAGFPPTQSFFEGIPGLVRKYFCFDEAAMRGTSVYIWKDRASADACLTSPEFLARFRKSFNCEPDIRYCDIKLVVDGKNV